MFFVIYFTGKYIHISKMCDFSCFLQCLRNVKGREIAKFVKCITLQQRYFRNFYKIRRPIFDLKFYSLNLKYSQIARTKRTSLIQKKLKFERIKVYKIQRKCYMKYKFMEKQFQGKYTHLFRQLVKKVIYAYMYLFLSH